MMRALSWIENLFSILKIQVVIAEDGYCPSHGHFVSTLSVKLKPIALTVKLVVIIMISTELPIPSVIIPDLISTATPYLRN